MISLHPCPNSVPVPWSRAILVVCDGVGAAAVFAILSSPTSTVLPAAVTTPIRSRFHDRDDVNDPAPRPEQRQQQKPIPRTHIEATSVGISPPRLRLTARQQQQSEQQQLAYAFSDELEDSSDPVASSYHSSPEVNQKPHRAVRISKHTASAILFTVEEALRNPNPFTPDLIEENALMSDLVGGGSAAAGNGRSGNVGSRGQGGGPGSTGSPGIKGPRDIMRERNAREARRKAEQEALERVRAEEEARLLEEQRQSTERRAAAAGAVGGGTRKGSGGDVGQRMLDNPQRSDRRTGDRIASGPEHGAARIQEPPLQGRGTGGRAVGGGEPAATRPRGPSQSQGQPRPTRAEAIRPGAAQPTPAPVPTPGPTTTAQPPGNSTGGPTRSSFPHAFERWETLSAHWEGLTSFWIRRLEENKNEIDRDPLSQQLSRQVTDLSAAGANLFHAVVELQRLRASSERKFQRWFFETRAEQERAQEVQAMLEATLEEERRGRAEAIADAVAVANQNTSSEKLLSEMKRELQISKEEARRAWDELGKREQEERERTISLRDGQPTLVGGVQVVPMMQGVPSRHGSARDPPPARQSPFSAAGGASGAGQAVQEPEHTDEAYQQYAQSQRADSADPFTEAGRTTTPSRAPRTATSVASTASLVSYPKYTQAPAVQPAATGGFYQQQQDEDLHTSDPTGRAANNQSYPSEAAMSEQEYEIDPQGQFIRDEGGNKIRYHERSIASDDDTDEYDVAAEREQELAYLQQYGQPPVSGVEYGRGPTTTASGATSTSRPAGEQTTGADYSGQGYGSGWESVPRHHHPTRLSDVLEEDERSRTSASQVSRRE
ncbi:hypothetical protein PVAG01_08724 [Phlyctema vagabunda]|uniref:Uncharacterized protein n=1 Tax=Phlyctema vagabunda TaxID=108571 RepID=A0ABR4PAB5_9HELO